MRTRLLLIALRLAAGAAASVLVAWACAIWAPNPPVANAAPRPLPPGTSWPRPVPADWPPAASIVRGSSWGLTLIAVGAIRPADPRRLPATRPDDLPQHMQILMQAGWPLRCLDFEVRRATAEPDALERFGDLGQVPGWAPPDHRPRRLPGRPIWAGLAVDSVLLSVVLWLLEVLVTLRRRVRRWQGRCLACGYDLRGADHGRCPECGRTTASPDTPPETPPDTPPGSAAAPLPRVTVVTPSCNQAGHLRQCIDSVLAQDYPDVELLVLDGGSTDGSVEILRSYGDAITWRSERDRGQAAAINEGLARATGEIVAWLNSDDYHLPGAVRRAVACLQRDPEAGLVHGRALMVDAAGRTIREYPTFAFARRHLRRKCYVCQPTVFIRRRVVDEVGPLNEHLDICFDYEWWLRIGRRHRLAFCPHVLAASRHYAQTKTASRRLRALVEAGYLMRRHFGRASWRWSAKWIVHRHGLRRSRFMVPVGGWVSALMSARRYRRRFDARRPPSRYGRRLLARLG